MPIYCFYWGNDEDESFIMKIEANKEVVEKLLDEYRNSDEGYNDFDWFEFLKSKGIKAKFIQIDHYIYF
jgi:iron uptake system EfeUOB component EfeO/EfeM